jgi:hypothetical protein
VEHNRFSTSVLCHAHLHPITLAVGRTHLVAENQMCFVAAFADAFETIDGMTVILRRQAKQRS